MITVDKNLVLKSLRQTALERLRELADRSYQEQAWVGLLPGVISSFTEACCGLFDDSGLTIAFDKNEPYFGKEIDDRLKKLGDVLAIISDDRPLMHVIEDPSHDNRSSHGRRDSRAHQSARAGQLGPEKTRRLLTSIRPDLKACDLLPVFESSGGRVLRVL